MRSPRRSDFKIFACRDVSDFLILLMYLLSYVHSVYTRETCMKIWGLQKNASDVYGNSRANFLEILAFVFISSLIPSVRGFDLVA